MNTFFWGSSLLSWIYALGIIIASILIAKGLYWLFKNTFRKLTAKSSVRFYELLLDKIEEPIVFGVVIIGIWWGLSLLSKSEQFSVWLKLGYHFLIVFNIAWFIARFLDAIIEEYLTPLVRKTEGDMDDQLLPLARKSLKIAIWLLAGIIALSNAGYNVGALLTGLGIGGLAFALAAQETIANLLGGLTILTDRPFKLKDRIVMSGYDGFVEEIGIRSTRLRTLAGRLVTIPNSLVTKNVVENISSEPGRKMVLQFNLPHSTDHARLTQALKILKDIAYQDEGVDKKEVISSFEGFAASCLIVQLIYWIRKEGDLFAVPTSINLAILKAFNENGYTLAYPTQTIVTREGK